MNRYLWTLCVVLAFLLCCILAPVLDLWAWARRIGLPRWHDTRELWAMASVDMRTIWVEGRSPANKEKL